MPFNLNEGTQEKPHMPEEEVATDGDIPIGTNKINTGQGVNNYVPPAMPVQGFVERLIATKE